MGIVKRLLEFNTTVKSSGILKPDAAPSQFDFAKQSCWFGREPPARSAGLPLGRTDSQPPVSGKTLAIQDLILIIKWRRTKQLILKLLIFMDKTMLFCFSNPPPAGAARPPRSAGPARCSPRPSCCPVSKHRTLNHHSRLLVTTCM